MYLEFQITPVPETANELWSLCCGVMTGKVKLNGLDYGRNLWMAKNMRHSGIDESIHFMKHYGVWGCVKHYNSHKIL